MSKTIFVSPQGNDKASGTVQAPFASLQRVQQELRSVISSFVKGEEKDIEIHLAPGFHRLEETLVLDQRDSGTDNFKVSWIGSKEGRTVISSGYPLSLWKKLKEDPDGLPPDLHGRLWVLDLPKGSRVNNLYGSEGLVPRARGEAMIPQSLSYAQDVIPTTIYGPDSPIDNRQKQVPYSHDCFAFSEGAIAQASDLAEAECVIIPRNQWTMNILPVGKVDFDRNILHLQESCTYPIAIPHCAPNGSIWLENSLSVMTPGSWVFHRESSRLYYCPKGEIPEEGLEATLLTELIRLEGSEDEKGLNPLQNIHFSHIEFTGTNRFSFHGLTGRGIQHDWEMHDASSCMVRFRYVQNSSLTHCRFTQGGSGGVRLDLASSQNTIADCDFSHLGGCGIVLCGYGLSRKYLNRSNIIKGNHLHHLGLFYWHCPGIFIWQSGDNLVSDNYLHDLPYTALVCSGRSIYDREGKGECSRTINWDDVESQCGKNYVHNVWHYSGLTSWSMREPLMHSRDNLIEYNRIHDVMQIMGDGNGIYVSGGGGGNVVRYNAVGPCPSPTMAEGIRCDDDQHFTILHGNLIFGIGGHATGITIKGVNQITNNIIALPFVQETKRGMLSLETGPLNGAVIKHNIFYTDRAEQTFVSEIRIHGTGRKARLRDTESNHNIYYCTGQPSLGEEWVSQQQGFGNDYDSLGCDPGFVGAEKGDFTLASDSPARACGFKPLPLERMLEQST